jgi:hypothetical protein
LEGGGILQQWGFKKERLGVFLHIDKRERLGNDSRETRYSVQMG